MRKPDTLARLSSPPRGRHNPKSSENTTASTSTANASGEVSPPGPAVDAVETPKEPPAVLPGDCDCWCQLTFIPGGDGRKEWQRLFDAASKVEIVAIANPNSGPGDERNLEYAAIFTEARNAGTRHHDRGLREY